MENGLQVHFKVGSRQSQLAMIQTKWVIEFLKPRHPEATFEIVGISTIGDKILDVALSKIGDKGLFTQELETALLIGEIDFVVHSLKDLPTQLPEGLTIAAISKREDPRDAVIFKDSIKVQSLDELPPGSGVGTSSLRRIAQLKRRFPHLKFLDVRGNLNTRFRKLDDPTGPYQALILAAAGVNRMGWEGRIGQLLEWNDCMHAVGQGALGIECKSGNAQVLDLLSDLNDPTTYLRCMAERSFLRVLEGGCSVPVAVHSEFDEEKKTLLLKGSVWSLDGSKSVSDSLWKALAEESVCDKNASLTSVHARRYESQGLSPDACYLAFQLGVELGHVLIQKGAKDILEEIKSQPK